MSVWCASSMLPVSASPRLPVVESSLFEIALLPVVAIVECGSV